MIASVTAPSKAAIAPPPTVPDLQSQPQAPSNSFPADPPSDQQNSPIALKSTMSFRCINSLQSSGRFQDSS